MIKAVEENVQAVRLAEEQGILGVYLDNKVHVRHQLLEELLKITYLILTIFITLSSFSLIAVSFVSFLCTLIFGNIVLRITYELSILLIKICKNTSDINDKLKK